MVEINPAVSAPLQQAAKAPQPPPKTEVHESTDGSAGDSPSIQIDPALLARIEEESVLQGVNRNLDTAGARELALQAQQQLATQTLSIANKSPQVLQGLFR